MLLSLKVAELPAYLFGQARFQFEILRLAFVIAGIVWLAQNDQASIHFSTSIRCIPSLSWIGAFPVILSIVI